MWCSAIGYIDDFYIIEERGKWIIILLMIYLKSRDLKHVISYRLNPHMVQKLTKLEARNVSLALRWASRYIFKNLLKQCHYQSLPSTSGNAWKWVNIICSFVTCHFISLFWTGLFYQRERDFCCRPVTWSKVVPSRNCIGSLQELVCSRQSSLR